jgi:hypothetical protein
VADSFKFLNRTEERVYRALEEIASTQGLSVFPKVRFIDTFDERGVGLSGAQKSFAMKAHIDFLLVRPDMTPFMAIEFDGPTHESVVQRQRDATKNALCARSGLPLARIRSSYLNRSYGGMNALRWIVETTDLSIAFDEAQEKGELPPDEGFDPMMVAGVGGWDDFPYWISAEAQAQLNSWLRDGKIRGFADVSGHSEDGSFHRTVSVVELADGSWVVKMASMREQLLPYHYTDFLQMACVCEAVEKTKAILRGDAKPLHPEIALRRLRVLCGELRGGSGGGTSALWERARVIFKTKWPEEC